MTNRIHFSHIMELLEKYLIRDLAKIVMNYATPNKQTLQLHKDLDDWFNQDPRSYRTGWIYHGLGLESNPTIKLTTKERFWYHRQLRYSHYNNEHSWNIHDYLWRYNNCVYTLRRVLNEDYDVANNLNAVKIHSWMIKKIETERNGKRRRKIESKNFPN